MTSHGIPVLGQPTGPAASALDVTEASFGVDVVERSHQVPVVIDLWAEWCAPCRQLGPVLEKLAAEAAGAWVLAKIDVDANPRLAQALQVQGIPAVKAVVGGELVAEFTGALPEAQIRTWLAQLMEAAGGGQLPEEPITEPLVPVEVAPDLPVLDQAAVDRLLDIVRRTTAAERDEARLALLDLLGHCSPDDPAVLAARRALASALY